MAERTGKDLREVGLLVGSGGVLRHAGPRAVETIRRHLSTDGGWQLPEQPHVVVDTDYVLAPAGLLADAYPEAAARLVERLRCSGRQYVPSL